MNEYESLRKEGFIGFAQLYLRRCNKESMKDDGIDIQVYTKLVELDSKLGTTASEQLARCLQFTTRSDVIKVKIIVVNSHI